MRFLIPAYSLSNSLLPSFTFVRVTFYLGSLGLELVFILSYLRECSFSLRFNLFSTRFHLLSSPRVRLFTSACQFSNLFSTSLTFGRATFHSDSLILELSFIPTCATSPFSSLATLVHASFHLGSLALEFTFTLPPAGTTVHFDSLILYLAFTLSHFRMRDFITDYSFSDPFSFSASLGARFFIIPLILEFAFTVFHSCATFHFRFLVLELIFLSATLARITFLSDLLILELAFTLFYSSACSFFIMYMITLVLIYYSTTISIYYYNAYYYNLMSKTLIYSVSHLNHAPVRT